MRIAVSGAHSTGKSTLVADFSAKHPEFLVLGDPHDVGVDGDTVGAGGAGVDSFLTQFHTSLGRLGRLRRSGRPDPGVDGDLIMERCPLDFLAYLQAWETLGRPGGGDVWRDLVDLAAAGISSLDLLVLLPVTQGMEMDVPREEDLELRDAMDTALCELGDDPDVVSPKVTVLEVVGSRAARLMALETAVRAQN